VVHPRPRLVLVWYVRLGHRGACPHHPRLWGIGYGGLRCHDPWVLVLGPSPGCHGSFPHALAPRGVVGVASRLCRCPPPNPSACETRCCGGSHSHPLPWWRCGTMAKPPTMAAPPRHAHLPCDVPPSRQRGWRHGGDGPPGPRPPIWPPAPWGIGWGWRAGSRGGCFTPPPGRH